MKRSLAILAVCFAVSCAWPPWTPPNPQPTPTPTPTPEPCPPLDVGWCHEAEPPMSCGDCKHQPPEEPCPIMAPPCAPPPLPEPQCPSFTDRGGTLRLRTTRAVTPPTASSAVALEEEPCDCYLGEVWIDCPDPPPQEGCSFPQGIPNENFTAVSNPGTLGSVVNATMADLSGCAVGTDCPITFPADVWMGLVNDRLREQGFCAGRHVDTPPGHEVCPPGSGCTDQISVKREDFCDGRPHENYQVFNYGGKKVRWAPGGTQDAWLVECEDGPVDPPPIDGCSAPLPPRDHPRSKTKINPHGNVLDSTASCHGCEYCESIGFPCMPGTGPGTERPCVPRCDCPVRPEGNPERIPCERYFYEGLQLWKGDGEVLPPCSGQRRDRCVTSNPAQARCSTCSTVEVCRSDGTHCSAKSLE